MRTLLAALTGVFLSITSMSHADVSFDSVGAGYWVEENPYLEVYTETDLGLHPQIFLGYEVFGVSLKTDPVYEKYGIEVAPYFGIGGADNDIEGLLGVEFDRAFTVKDRRVDTYFRLNIDFDNTEFMLGARYFFEKE